MSERSLHRIVVVMAITMVVSGATLFNAGAASATSSNAVRLVLQFNDAAKEAELIIPRPACPTAIPKCQWMLYMNLPLMPYQPRVGFVVGKHGVLVIPYPKFCGVIQADALVGPRSSPSTWVYWTGKREHIGNCGHPGTTTTTTLPVATTTTTTDPDATTTTDPATEVTTTTAPPQVAATTETPKGGGTTSALPFTEGSTTTSTVAKLVAAQLPFTGIDLKPLGFLGSTLIIIGGLMLTTVESRRRMLRRATAARLESLKDGARQTSSWFLGL